LYAAEGLHALVTDFTIVSFDKNFPKDYSLDAEHTPHISVFGGYFYTSNLDKTYAAVEKVLASEKVLSWKMKAFK
jgi:hypothetical protein